MVGSYDPTLVTLSYLIATAASFVALDLTGRVTVSRGLPRVAWLAAGSLTMGLGIWAMHFVGMLAFELPVQVRYDVRVVFLSTVPAVAASGMALWIAGGRALGARALLLGSLAMGAAIAGMHYVGMAAMRSSASLSYRPALVALSVAIAVLASSAALWMAFNLRRDEVKRVTVLRGGAAFIMGVAVVGMHYTGMAAAVFAPSGLPAPTEGAIAGSDVVVGVAGVALLATAVALLASFADRQTSRQRIFQMTMIMTAVAVGVAIVSVGALYRTAKSLEARRLQDFASRPARLIEMLASLGGAVGASPAALPLLMGGAQQQLGGFGETGELLIARAVGDRIVFLGPDQPQVPRDSASGYESMRRALAGESGSVIHRDQRGVSVLAAYEPIEGLGLGIVAKMDMAELRAPLIRTGLLAGSVALGLVFLGSLLLARIGNPMLERLEEGAFFDSVLSSFPSPLLIEGPDRLVRRVNPAFERVFGRSKDTVEGRALEESFGQGAGPAALRALAEKARGGESSSVTSELLSGDGRTVPVRASAAAVGGMEEGALVLVAEDITTMRETQAALEAAAAVAREASASKSAFLANMSHEIRTPMNGVMGMLELLLETELDPSQRESATMAMGSAEALLVVLNDLLDFSKIEAGHLELERIHFDLPKLVNDTTRVMALNAARRGNELLVDVNERTPTMVTGDPGRLRQVLTNLLGNAVKFTKHGEVLVSVRPTSLANGSAEVEFTIRDTGIGIPESKLEAIFEEFTQADVSVTRTHGGTGLGLSISRRLIALMGGTMHVESEVGAGSTFSFVVPLPAAPREAGSPARRASAGLDGKHLLVVDDNATARRILRQMVAVAGARVDEASDADAALELMLAAQRAGRPYDAVIVDSIMPMKDGFALAAEVQSRPELAGTRLMMMTSAGEQAGRRKAREHGIMAYLVKPVPRSDLLRAVGQVLGLRGPGQGEERRIITDESLAAARTHARILLAEDNAVNRTIARAMLEKRGYSVEVVENGQEAVEQARAERFDVILMDVQMPVMDGLQATRIIRAMDKHADVPIIAVTAHALEEERRRCREAGMNGFVSKPFKASELSDTIDALVRPRTRAAAPPGGEA